MNRKYNILILCGANPYKGPGIIALDIYKKFAENGNVVRILSNQKLPPFDKNIIELSQPILTKYRIFRRIHKYLHRSDQAKISQKYLMFSLEGQFKSKWAKKIINKIDDKVDIIIYLFSHNYLSYVDFEKISNNYKVPILFWMVDQALLTGGCHYPWNCDGYKKYCGNCPGIQSGDSEDLTKQNMKYKKNVFDAIELYPIYCTDVQKLTLSESLIFRNYKQYKVPVPIDEETFHPGDREKSRPKYNLSVHKKMIFFASQQIEDERKGIRHLFNAFNILATKLSNDEKENLLLVIAGNQISGALNLSSYDHQFLGYLSHTEFAEVLSVMDVFVCPSVEDAGPMVINQSMMCSTPVVAFDIGVASEIIQTGVTGYRAILRDDEDLANGILQLLRMDREESLQMSKQCREFAIELFSVEKVTRKYYSIFEEVLN